MPAAYFSRMLVCLLLISCTMQGQQSPSPSSSTNTKSGTSSPPAATAPVAAAEDKDNSPHVSLTAPTVTPVVVEDAAHEAAHVIISKKLDPLSGPEAAGEVHAKWRRLVLFALAAAADPDKAEKVSNIGSSQAETSRTDKQLSASSSTTGSTSAVEKPGLPYLLGLAISHGAIDQNINGSTLNLSSSLYAVAAAYKHEDTAATYDKCGEYTRVGFSAAYDLQDQNDPLASVHRRQLSEFAVKLRLLGDHSPRSKDAHKLFRDQLEPLLQKRGILIAEIFTTIFPKIEQLSLFPLPDETQKQISNCVKGKDPCVNPADAEQKIIGYLVNGIVDNVYKNISTFSLTEKNVRQLSDFLQNYKTNVESFANADKIFNAALKQLEANPALTLAYFNERGSGTPNYSVGKLIFEKKPQNFMQIDANISTSFYSHPDRTKNEQTFRDVAAALGLEKQLGRSPFLTDQSDQSQMTFSFSGRYQRLQENRHITGKKADIAVANWKLEIPVATGVSLPLSLTYANATELIKEQHVRGNFGLTFDLDKLRSIIASK